MSGFSFATPASKPAFSFSQPAATTTTPAQTPAFSFGNTNAASNNSSTAPAPAFSFGAQNAQQQTQTQQSQQPAASGSGLFSFGNTSAQQTQQPGSATQPAASGFSFGSLGKTTSTPAVGTSAPLSFNIGGTATSSTNNTASTAPKFSFGATAPATTAPTLNFGSTLQQPQQQQQQQQQPQNAVASTSQAPISKTTKYEDLPEQARKVIEDTETYIQGRIAIYDELKSRKLGKEIEETSVLLSRHTVELRSRFEQSLRDAVKAVQIVDAHRAPPIVQPGGIPTQPPTPHPTFLQELFRRKAEEMGRRLATYKTSIEQVQGQLSRSDPDQVKAILPTLKAQHTATLQLASRLASLEGNITELKDEYRDLWRDKTGSVRDPFIERRREVLGAENGVLDSVGSLSLR